MQKVIAIAIVLSVIVGQGSSVNAYAVDNSVDSVSISNYGKENVVILDTYGDLETFEIILIILYMRKSRLF